MALKPLDDRVVVKPMEAETKTASGIYLPEGAADKPHHGKVVAVGPGKFKEDGSSRTPLTVKKGDTVVFSKYAGSKVEIKGDEHLIMRESELLGLIED